MNGYHPTVEQPISNAMGYAHGHGHGHNNTMMMNTNMQQNMNQSMFMQQDDPYNQQQNEYKYANEYEYNMSMHNHNHNTIPHQSQQPTNFVGPQSRRTLYNDEPTININIKQPRGQMGSNPFEFGYNWTT